MVFEEIERILPFENLRNDKERSNFIICSQAMVVGMTTDYAQSRLEKLKAIGFSFSSLLVDNSSTIPDYGLLFLL